jgi:hypothetical protein
MWEQHLAAISVPQSYIFRGKMPLPQSINILNIAIEIAIGIEIGPGDDDRTLLFDSDPDFEFKFCMKPESCNLIYDIKVMRQNRIRIRQNIGMV